MTGVIATIPRNQFFDTIGKPLAGGELYTYLAGTTTPVATYQGQDLTTKNKNPIPLDANGSCSIWLDPAKSYKFVLNDKNGVTVPGWPVDNVSGAGTPLSLSASFPTLTSLASATGAALMGFVPTDGSSAKRTVQDKLRDTVNVNDFGADPTGADDSTAQIQFAYLGCQAAGKIPVFGFGNYKITRTIDAKGLPLIGMGRNHSKILCNVADGTRTFQNVGQVVRDLWFKGPGNGAKPDGFSSSGYKRYIEGCYFDSMGDCFCPTDIIVTTVIDRAEFFSSQNVVNDKLCDGASAHTTLYLTNSNVLYGVNGFTLKTEVIGWEFDNVVFEDMANIFKGVAGKQVAGSTLKGLWIEQVNQSCTIFNGIYAGSTNVYHKVTVRNNATGTAIIYDANKVVASQFTNAGDGSGGGGGLVFDQGGLRLADFTGNGVIMRPTGIIPSAANANYSNALDYTHQTQMANANQASRGGDYIFNMGLGSLGSRRGVPRPIDDMATDFGAQDFRWAKSWFGYLKGSGSGGYVAANQPIHELNNNQPNAVCLATYNADTGPFAACHQAEFAAPTGAVNGAGFLYLGKNNGNITYRVDAGGNVTNTNNSYGAVSDIKLKENVVDGTPKLADLMRVRVVNYNLKTEPSVKQLGVIAQELEQIFPGMVEETPDFTEVDNEQVATGTSTKHVKYSVFVLMLIKALQELKADFDAYRASHP